MSLYKTAIRQFLSEQFLLDTAAQSYADGDSFMALHLLDSMGFMELVSFLEERFGITVDDGEMVPANLDSLNALDAFIARKRGEG
jgi:acyl carrier protein